MASPEFEAKDRAPPADAGGVFRSAVARDAGGTPDPGRCEDAVPVLKELSGERVLLGVADGLGGYPQGFDNRSGGQIAADTAMEVARDCFSRSVPGQRPDPEALTNAIFKRLRRLAETRLEPNRLRGTLGRHKLATTLALALLEAGPGASITTIRCYWIGDSRIYFWDSAGLHQLSRDDNLTGADAFDATFDPPPMSQFLAASMEREWRINLRERVLDCPGVVIACTDGCYSEWPSPWDFEAALQESLDESKSWKDWAERFRTRLEPLLSDDASLVAFPVNLSDFDEFRKIRAKPDGALARCLKAEREDGLPATEIWSSIYKRIYESLPALDEGRVSPAVRGVLSDPAASNSEDSDYSGFEAAQPSDGTGSRIRTVSRPSGRWLMPALAWLAGFACGVPAGQQIMAWLDLFWRWFLSLWQFT
jgi:hypothetical protein